MGSELFLAPSGAQEMQMSVRPAVIKLKFYLLTAINVIVYSSRMFQNVSECSRIYAECSRMYAEGSRMYAERMFQNVPKCSRMFQNVPECTRMFQNVSECSRMYAECGRCISVR